MTKSIFSERGFWIALLCMAVVTVSNGLINSGLSVYDEVLLTHFDVSIGQLKLRDSISFLGSSLFVLIAGVWVDRHGTKRALMVGLVLLALVYSAYPMATSLTQVYGLHVLFAVVLACAGNMTAIVTAAHAFPDRKGLAIGMAVAGTSVGGILIPPLATRLIEDYGWQTAMRIEAVIPLIAMFVVLKLLPAKLGSRSEDTATGEARVGFGGVLRNTAFYRITLAASLTYYATLSLFSHLFLYLRSLDVAPQQAAFGLSVLAASALVGKLIGGYISDRLPFDGYFRIQMSLMLIGVTGIAFAGDWLWFAVVIAGFGWGGLHALYNIVLVRLFGLTVAGRVNSTVSVAEAIGGSIGIAVTGWLADAAGYPTAFAVASALCAVALLLVLTTPTPEHAPDESAT